MRATINNTLVNNLKLTGKIYEVRDTKLTGFIVRVSAAGSMSYLCQYGRSKRTNICKVGVLSPAQAREQAKEILGDAAKGIEPNAAKQLERKQMSLKKFITQEYHPWVVAHRKAGKLTVDRIKRCFYQDFSDLPLDKITVQAVDKWRTERVNKGRSKYVVNTDIATLKAVFSKAVEWEMIEVHPLKKLKPLRVDQHSNTRFLSTDEEQRLRCILDKREDRIKQERNNANCWREERAYPLLPAIPPNQFADHLKPMVLLSINTGIRQGELFSLTWENIHFEQMRLTITSDNAKSGKTRHIPLNSETLDLLKTWYQQVTGKAALVFPSKMNLPFNNVRKSWQKVLKQADIHDFRWHDLRHHFASKLVMVGVDLNTVRELLGHSDIKMTLRYAHLAPEHKAKAVEKLVNAKW
ncbi:MAG: site-specific integrase [Gammaproteobacteria bacterium]